MDLTEQLHPFSKKEYKLKSRLEKILQSQDLSQQRQLIVQMVKQLDIDPIDCAAAFLLLSQPHLYPAVKEPTLKKQPELKPIQTPEPLSLRPIPPPKMVRYRIDVGQKHNATSEEIKTVFIEETGVDKKMIGEVDIRYHYTIIELPEGMPTDIYQLLTQVCIQQQKLNIKKIKARDRYSNPSQKHKSR